MEKSRTTVRHRQNGCIFRICNILFIKLESISRSFVALINIRWNIFNGNGHPYDMVDIET